MSLLLADWQALWCFWIIEGGNLGHDSPSHGVTSTLGSEWSSNFESPSMCRDSISQFNQVHLESVLIQRIIQHLIDLSWRKPQKSDHILLCGIYKAFQVWREKGSSARFGVLYHVPFLFPLLLNVHSSPMMQMHIHLKLWSVSFLKEEML